MRQRCTTVTLVTALMIGLPSVASAALFTAVGQSTSVSFDGNVEGNTVTGLSADATFLLTAIDYTANTAAFQITLENTSSAPVTASTVTAIGFDSTPNVLSGTSTSALFSNVNTGGQFPNGFGSIETCAISNPNNCTGGQSTGVDLGLTHVFTLHLVFGDLVPVDGLSLDFYGVRYQSINGAGLPNGSSGTGTGTEDPPPPPPPGCPPVCPPPPPEPIAEPATLTLMGLGLFGAGLLRRRRK